MDIFGIGVGEIFLILVLALILFGPAKIPEAARTIGKYTRALRKMSSDFTQAVSKEIELDEEAKKTGDDPKAAGDPVPNHMKDVETSPGLSSQVPASTAPTPPAGPRTGEPGS